MKSYIMLYPGDPPVTIDEMTRSEFLKEFPRFPIKISGGGAPTQIIPMGADEIWCDSCSHDPGDVVYVQRIRNVARGICKECFDESCKPYVKS